MKTCDRTKGFWLANVEYIFETWVFFLLYVVMTWKDFVIFTEESVSLLQKHQGMHVDSCLFIGSLEHKQ